MVGMINPIIIVAVGLGTAFFLGLFGKKSTKLPLIFMFTALAFMVFVSWQWFFAFFTGDHAADMIFTAGLKPPFSIALKMGRYESFFTFAVNVMGILSAFYLIPMLKKAGKASMSVFVVFVMALNVIIMTQDAFNLFVFMEIVSIALAGLVVLDNSDGKAISAGFKYMIIGSIISGLILMGVVFGYHFAGSLYLPDLIQANLGTLKGGSIAVLFILMAMFIEMKMYPSNGWALDLYQGAPDGIGAVISAVSTTAMVFVLAKLLPLGGEVWYSVAVWVGAITFILANLMGLKQTNTKRMLGYSSTGQTGLLVLAVGLSSQLGDYRDAVVFGFLVSHMFAKAGLFWISGMLKNKDLKAFAVIRKKPVLLFAMTVFVMALTAMPPFPSFFAKWQLLKIMASSQSYLLMSMILIGSLLEAVYLFRWLGYAIKAENEELEDANCTINSRLPILVSTISLLVIGWYSARMIPGGDTINFITMAFVMILFVIDFLPAWIKNTIVLAVFGYFSYIVLPTLEGFRLLFGAIFLFGGISTFFAGYAKHGKRIGFYPVAVMMYVGLVGIVQAENMLQFFFFWEMMTIGSYFLIIRGKKSMSHALSYIIFSVGGAMLILAGFAITYAFSGDISLDALKTVSGPLMPYVYAMLAIGFMTKTAAAGLHIWLPGAHAEAETDVSTMVSAILLKGGVFGLVILMLAINNAMFGPVSAPYLLAWLGAITALIGNLLAALEEDAKRLLAYSSIGNLGYILFALALMNNAGWMAAMALTVNHFLFKTILFLAVGGVVMRVKTRNMYEMGGLIKNMPFSFVSVLIGIITLSGIPPLFGFSVKWLSYNAIAESGFFYSGALYLVAGMVAFLYCFRLIHTIFLGQRKDEHIHVKEAPIWLLIPQYVFLVVIMVLSYKPGLFLKPMGKVISNYFPNNPIVWTGDVAKSTFGTWDAPAIMNVVGAIFVVLFIWLLIANRKAKKVKQFNIVYAAERPERPETTHYAYNFFAPYKRAFGVLAKPYATNFWNGTTEFSNALSDFFRRFYTGNGQAYIVHSIIFVVVVYLIVMGGF